MRALCSIGLITMLLLTACGQPADLPSSAPVSPVASATSEAASSVAQATVNSAPLVPCPTTPPLPSYPSPPLPGITPTPTSTLPPAPTIDPEAMPMETAPGGLGGITVPNDAETMRGIFAAMPKALGDYQRSENDYSSVHSFSIQYQHPGLAPSEPQFSLSLDALDSSGESSFPDKSEFLNSDSRRDGEVFYTYTDRQYFEPLDGERQNCRDVRLVSITFVIGETPWFFRAHAPSREVMEALIAAFVQAVKASPAPIPYSTPTPAPTIVSPGGYPGTAIYPPPQDTMVPTMPTPTPLP